MRYIYRMGRTSAPPQPKAQEHGKSHSLLLENGFFDTVN